MAYGCTTATTVALFPDKRGLASGLNAAGFGSGAVVFAPVAAALNIVGLALMLGFQKFQKKKASE